MDTAMGRIELVCGIAHPNLSYFSNANQLQRKMPPYIPKQKFRVQNWKGYDAGLRERGSLTMWITDEAIAHWQAAPRLTPGRQPCYSDMAIETGLMVRLVFHLPLRQTEGLMSSIFKLLGVSLAVPDHSTLSRRAMNLKSISKGNPCPQGQSHLLKPFASP